MAISYNRPYIKKTSETVNFFSMEKENKFTSFLKENGSDPKVHPNGFIQIPISDKIRVHFWHHSIPRQKTRTPIHDHIWDMKSFVLKGRMINIIHDFKESENGGFEIYTPQYGELYPTGKKLVKKQENIDLVNEDESYFVERGSFHESVPVEPSITVIEKKNKDSKKPRILISDGKKPDNNFNRKDALEDGEIWNLVNSIGNSEIYDKFDSLEFED